MLNHQRLSNCRSPFCSVEVLFQLEKNHNPKYLSFWVHYLHIRTFGGRLFQPKSPTSSTSLVDYRQKVNVSGLCEIKESKERCPRKAGVRTGTASQAKRGTLSAFGWHWEGVLCHSWMLGSLETRKRRDESGESEDSGLVRCLCSFQVR